MEIHGNDRRYHDGGDHAHGFPVLFPLMEASIRSRLFGLRYLLLIWPLLYLFQENFVEEPSSAPQDTPNNVMVAEVVSAHEGGGAHSRKRESGYGGCMPS